MNKVSALKSKAKNSRAERQGIGGRKKIVFPSEQMFLWKLVACSQHFENFSHENMGFSSSGDFFQRNIKLRK